MTDFIAEASDTDLADQAVSVGDLADDADPFAEDIAENAEANTADVFEQHQSVPEGDDEYGR